MEPVDVTAHRSTIIVVDRGTVENTTNVWRTVLYVWYRLLNPPDLVHTRSPRLSSAQLSVLRSPPPHGGRVPYRGGPPWAGSMLMRPGACTQEQRDVCAEHHTVSMAFHARTLPMHSSIGHG